MESLDTGASSALPDDVSEVEARVEEMGETFSTIMGALVDQNCESQALVRGMTYLIGFAIFAVLMFFAVVFWFADVCAKGREYNNLSENLKENHDQHKCHFNPFAFHFSSNNFKIFTIFIFQFYLFFHFYER